VIDLDAAFGEELLDVSVGKTEPQVPAAARVMTSGGTGTRRRRSASVAGEGIGEIS